MIERKNKHTHDDVIYDKISHYDELSRSPILQKNNTKKNTVHNILKMKQKDNTDIFYEIRFVNLSYWACQVTLLAPTCSWKNFEVLKILKFFKPPETNSQILGRREPNDFAP